VEVFLKHQRTENSANYLKNVRNVSAIEIRVMALHILILQNKRLSPLILIPVHPSIHGFILEEIKGTTL
jgi:hypothetical protein